MRDLRRLQAMVSAIRKEGPTNDLMKQTIILLADHVVELHRELDQVSARAARAERMSRMGLVR